MAAEDIYKLVKAECPDIGLATENGTVVVGDAIGGSDQFG